MLQNVSEDEITEEQLTGSNGFAFAPKITENGNAILYINPKFNVYVATSYYKYLLDKCGSSESAIIGYNTGYCNPTKNSKAYYKGKDYLQKVNSFVNFINKHNFDRFVRNH